MNVSKWQIGCIVLGIIMGFTAGFVENKSGEQIYKNKIKRGDYGQGDQEETFLVEGLLDKRTEISVTLEQREYEKEEAEEMFPIAYEYLILHAKGQNASWEKITEPLQLMTWIKEYGISAEWQSYRREVIDPSGEVCYERCSPNGETCYLKVCLRAGEYSRIYKIKAVVYPPEQTEEEKGREEFEGFLKELDGEQKTTEYLILPEQFHGKRLSYHKKNSSEYWIFPLLGVITSLLLPLRKKQKIREAKKKREKELLLDYSEVVSKLVIFLGAGMPMRKAWERVVRDYEEKAKRTGESRAAYEEMKQVYYLMERGVPETSAYLEFGNRCRLLPYRKLAGMLEQNVRNGTKGLREILEHEMEDAFIQRKLLAKKMGEEAGTKLLFPLIMMLGVVMIILTVPAFLSFKL